MPILTTNWVAVWKPPTTDGAKSLGDDQQEEAKEQTKQAGHVLHHARNMLRTNFSPTTNAFLPIRFYV
jgi:hypothetical protein